MGGFFGATSKHDVMLEVFFGVDYHSHLSIRRGGIAAYDKEHGLQREIHNIENSPFRTKFEHVLDEMRGNSAIGCISDTDPQPLLIRSSLGTYAICTVGKINNADELVSKYLSPGGRHFDTMTGGKVNSTELLAAIISQKDTFSEGIRYAHDVIDGTAAILILKDDGSIIAARDKLGRLPVLVSKNDEGRCVSLESFACHKFGYESEKELGPGEIVEFTADKLTVLSPAHKEMKMCAFMWTYYGYPASTYEGVNVELMRYQNGKSMAEHDKKHGTLPDIDYVCGIPDSGVPHAIGYSAECGLPFSRPLVKYTPTWSRSFVPQNQSERSKIAKMKQLPVYELIRDKKLLFIDDSIVRGTQLRETVNFLFESGAREMHIRSASPPLMYRCKYLNFTRAVDDMELIARRTIHELEGDEGIKYLDEYSNPTTERGKKMREAICKKFNFTSLEFQTLEGMIKAIGMDPSKLCTYCWNGKE